MLGRSVTEDVADGLGDGERVTVSLGLGDLELVIVAVMVGLTL